jgi:cysteinyl-tRNA synthetase
MIKLILENGYAYEVNGSVYFDVKKYSQTGNYGKLSGRKIEDLISGTREVEGGQEKRDSLDFALWKKANVEHIMRWPSPWSEGFPGWHLECSAMSAKYLGKMFDIHGGGMDLLFPHHECEIAQSNASHHHDPVKYWLHNNMITINGQKMGKSLGNFITLQELFSGNHKLLTEAYSPMTIRFFMLQAHYRSTLDFSNEALLAARKGYKKIINGLKVVKGMTYQDDEGISDSNNAQQIDQIIDSCYDALNDDFNTALAIGHIFNLLKKINSLHTQSVKYSDIGREVFEKMKSTYISLIEDVLGLMEEKPAAMENIVQVLLDIYKEAKATKEYSKVDQIRAEFKKIGIVVKDMKTGIDWAYEE